ncbi:hypothetical protein BJ508DRAFT_334041 [Ascobolus immersus RN42]|uniref:Uncharacterized protein n=1 Tax=Ascobolus immersus RN42 TaxID=1160509 RepID=A0A3N4HHF7_ASCIM|nr:hypothetical protein BJ508DRAFT_334041 [Ascobolus immersus RN42]
MTTPTNHCGYCRIAFNTPEEHKLHLLTQHHNRAIITIYAPDSRVIAAKVFVERASDLYFYCPIEGCNFRDQYEKSLGRHCSSYYVEHQPRLSQQTLKPEVTKRVNSKGKDMWDYIPVLGSVQVGDVESDTELVSVPLDSTNETTAPASETPVLEKTAAPVRRSCRNVKVERKSPPLGLSPSPPIEPDQAPREALESAPFELSSRSSTPSSTVELDTGESIDDENLDAAPLHSSDDSSEAPEPASGDTSLTSTEPTTQPPAQRSSSEILTSFSAFSTKRKAEVTPEELQASLRDEYRKRLHQEMMEALADRAIDLDESARKREKLKGWFEEGIVMLKGVDTDV